LPDDRPGQRIGAIKSNDMVNVKTFQTGKARADSPAPGVSEVWIGHNEPNTRGLAQDIQTAMMKDGSYVLTPQEVDIVYLALAGLHDLEAFGYQRDWEGITNYCPRTDDPQNTTLHRRTVSVEVSGHDSATVAFCAHLVEQAVCKATDKLLKRSEVKKDNTLCHITVRPGRDANSPTEL
jgi:hypothetical protein